MFHLYTPETKAFKELRCFDNWFCQNDFSFGQLHYYGYCCCFLFSFQNTFGFQFLLLWQMDVPLFNLLNKKNENIFPMSYYLPPEFPQSWSEIDSHHHTYAFSVFTTLVRRKKRTSRIKASFLRLYFYLLLHAHWFYFHVQI